MKTVLVVLLCKTLGHASYMYYLRARFYDPDLKRFISEDPAKDGGNWYAYCGNNPVNACDPSGMTEVMLRYIVEKNGGEVSWNEETSTVTATLNGNTVEYQGSIINGRMVVDSGQLMSDFGLTEEQSTHQNVDTFSAKDDAAMAFGLMYNPLSCQPNGVEYQSYIYENEDGTFSYDDVEAGVDLGNGFRTVQAGPPNPNRKLVAWAHTYGPYPDPSNPDTALDNFTGQNTLLNSNNETYTIGDGSYSYSLGVGGYVFTPGGDFKYLDYTKWTQQEQRWIWDYSEATIVILHDFSTR